MFSKFFIERPVLANVLALLMILIGAVALLRLPVAQYPPITPATVQVTTRYPGASPQVLVDTVDLPIEEQVNGVENMLYMPSTSASDGTYALIVTFEIGTDPDFAQCRPRQRGAEGPKDCTLIGTPAKRLETPDKVNGRAAFGIDTVLPGMEIVAIAISPVFGGKPKSLDEAAARAVRGVRQVVRTDDAVAVVADHMGAAKKGARGGRGSLG